MSRWRMELEALLFYAAVALCLWTLFVLAHTAYARAVAYGAVLLLVAIVRMLALWIASPATPRRRTQINLASLLTLAVLFLCIPFI